jgi:hypothetical protein
MDKVRIWFNDISRLNPVKREMDSWCITSCRSYLLHRCRFYLLPRCRRYLLSRCRSYLT